MNNGNRESVRRLYLAFALLLTLLLAVAYDLLAPASYPQPGSAISRGETWLSFLQSLLPNLAAALLAFAAVYTFAKWVGIAPDAADKTSHTPPAPLAMSPELAERLDRIETKLGETNAFGVVKFYQQYRQVDWNEWLLKAQRNQIIVVNYAHTWLGNHAPLLVDFLKKPNTSLTIYLPDPDDDATIKQLHSIYHDPIDPVSEDELRNKVRNTAKRLRGIAKSAGVSEDRIKVFWLKQRPNYALHVIDQRGRSCRSTITSACCGWDHQRS